MIRCTFASIPVLVASLFSHSLSGQQAAETWESTAGTTVSGTLLGIEGDAVGLALTDGRTIEAPYSRLIPQDQARVKATLTRLLTQSVSLEPGSAFPNLIELPEKFTTVKPGEKAGSMFVYESARCSIQSDVELPPKLASEVAVIFEGTLHFLSEVWEPFGEPRETRYNIRLFETIQALADASEEATEPGYDRGRSQLNCIWTTVGLTRGAEDAIELANSRTGYSQAEMVEMVFDQLKMRRASPIWIYEGIKQLLNDVRRDGRVFFPITSLQPIAQSGNFREGVLKRSGEILTYNNQKWYDESETDLAGKSSSYYFKELRLSAMVAVWTCLTDETFDGKSKLNEIFAEAKKGGAPALIKSRRCGESGAF